MSASSASRRPAAILALRLTPPAPPAELVERAELDQQLQAARNVSLVLFCAPAGFGKTTAMARYFDKQRSTGVATVWILLDDADNDVERFLFKVEAALDRSGLFGAGMTAGKSGGSARIARFDVPARLAGIQKPFAIFFDDFELLRNSVVLDLFKETLESLPAHGQAVVGTREHSRLNVGRWRATGRMVEIGPASLRLSATEARELLVRKSGCSLPQRALDQLYDRTEGWVAALQLAALTLAHHPDPSAFAWAFSGSNAAVADYLLETVMSGLSPTTREFLLATGILDELNTDLCNAVTGGSDSERLLDELERSNVFVAPIDDNRRRYRYHTLFADFLRNQLTRSHPGKTRDLHLAASAWFAADGRPVPAINHALASGDFQHTLGLLEVHAEHMLLEGRFRLLSRWFDGLPAELVEARPTLALVHACALVLTRRQQHAIRLLDSVESCAALSTADPESATLRKRVGALRGLALAMMDRSEECLEVCQRYCGSADRSAELPVAMVTNALASALINATRFDDAMAVLTAAKRRHAASGSAFNMAIAECVHAHLEVMLGHLPDALARLRGAMDSITQDRYRGIGGRATLGVSLAAALYHNDQLVEANQLLIECLPLVKETGPPDSLIVNHLLLARCARAMGETELSLRRLADLELFGHSSSLPRLVATVWLERAKWALIDGAIDASHDYLRQAASFTDVWEQAKRFPANANDIEDLAMATIRLQVRSGRGTEALSRLKAEIATAEAARRRTRAALLRLLQAEAMFAAGQSRPALRRMSDLIEWAATGGYVRLFVDEGTAVAKLLAEAPKSSKQTAFVDQVLKSMNWSGPIAVADMTADAGVGSVLIEPLSNRELEVLRMLDLGCSNKRIGERLFISENTVKVHLRNLNTKLAVGSRTQAVSAARRLGIIT
jgi:LuxR family transcriptional regulator, maltose regulon positive regulatory protein